MILSKKPGPQTEPVALAAVLIICAAAITRLPWKAKAATQPQEPIVAKVSYDAVWPGQQNVSDSSDIDSETPALAVTDSGVAHIVWEEGSRLYHSFREAGSWSDPSTIPGTGTSEQPALEAGPSNRVHLVYVNDVDVFYTDVFYVAWDGSDWSLPKNVSQTGESGESSQVSDAPDIAVAPDGSIHVVAVENTASGRQLYFASSNDGSSWPSYVPIPSAYGQSPSIDVAEPDAVHIAYRGDAEEDVYILSGMVSDWSLPQNISNTPSTSSTAPDLALGRSGAPEVVWQEMLSDTAQVRYSRGEAWVPVITLSESTAGASLPSLVIDGLGYRHVAWDDEAFPRAIRHTWTTDPRTWPDSGLVYGGSQPLVDVVLCAGPDGVVHAAWTEIQGGKGEILYASERFHDIFDVFLPLVLANGEP